LLLIAITGDKEKLSMLELKKPLAVIDLETTGTHLSNDRIVEIAIVRLSVNG
jgi:DNA polymerase-3 subunit epsilon